MEEGPAHKDNPLHSAIFDRNVQLLSDLLDKGEFIDSQDESGNTALHLATDYGYTEAVDVLLEEFRGVDLEITNESGDCPLHIAIKNRNLEIFCKLLKNEANINIPDKRGNTAFMLAVSNDFEAGAELLLEIDPMKFENDVELQYLCKHPHEFTNKEGNTCLHLIVLEKNLSLLKKFLEKFPDCCTNINDRNGRSPFHLALAHQFQQGCCMLSSTAPYFELDIEEDTGNTVLHTAVLNNNLSALGSLTIVTRQSNHDNLYNKNNNGDTALDLAVANNMHGAITLFLRESVDERHQFGDNPYLLHNAIVQQNETLLRTLFIQDIDINARDKQGRTPLHWAILTKFSPGVKLLLTNRADVNAYDNFRNTALHYSILGKSVALMEILVDNGADINFQNGDGVNPISLAVRKHFQVGFDFLLAKGAEIGVIDHDGNSLLHYAVRNCQSYGSTILNTLLSKREIYLHNINNTGWTALHVAAKEGLLSIVDYFLNKGVIYGGENSFSPLHAAVCQEKGKQNTKIIKKLCASGIDVNSSNKYGETHLQLASKQKYAAAVNILLENGARVDESDHNGNTALHYAVRECDSYDFEEIVLVVDILLSNGADINKSTKYGDTAIVLATTLGLETLACYLLEKGADVRVFERDKRYSLHEAVRTAKVSRMFLEKLLKLGLDPDIKDRGGTPLLYWAIKKSFATTVKLFIEYGANVNVSSKHYQLFLSLAARLRSQLILKYLINSGADINQKNEQGTALHSAVICKRYQNVKLLIENNINVNDTSFEGITALHEASRGYSQENEDVVLSIMKLLLDHGANINQKTTNNSTVLHIAVNHKEGNLVTFLLDNNANMNEQDSLGNTPLHRAVIKKHVKIVQLLVKSNASLDLMNNYGMTVLHLVVKHNLTECLDLLLDSYSEINVLNGNRETCIHIAVAHRYIDILKKFLSKGADINVRNEDGLTATSLAASKRFQTEVCLLLEREMSAERAANDRKEKALFNAVLKRKKRSVRRLIKMNVNVNYKNSKSVLHLAVLRNFMFGVKALIKAGADVNNKDTHGNSPLHLAVIVKSSTIMKMLLSHGADLECRNEDNRTPAHLAALNNFQQGFELLFNHRASLNIIDCEGNTAIYLAISKLNPNINGNNIKSDLHVNTLERYGFGVRAIIKDDSDIGEKSTPIKLITIVRGGFSNNLKPWRNESLLKIKESDKVSICLGTLSYFLEGYPGYLKRKVIQSFVDDSGNTPFDLDFPRQNVNSELCLHLAILLNFDFGIEALINTGVNVNQADSQGNTPLHLAVIVKSTTVMDMLIAHGARFHLRNELGKAAIHLATEMAFAEGINMLFEHGCSMDLQDSDGNTPLHLALNANTPSQMAINMTLIDPLIMVLLIENGANVNIADREDETFLSRLPDIQIPQILRKILKKLQIAFDENDDPHEYLLNPNAWRPLMDLEEVRQEVIMMKSLKFGRVSLVDVLKYHKDPQFIVNSPLKETIGSSSVGEKFPHYATLLKARFKRLQTRYLQLNEACMSLTLVDLPMEIRRRIFSELSTEDLVSVIEKQFS